MSLINRAKSYRVRERAHSELLYDLMIARGVVGKKAQEQFLVPDFERDSHDPMLLPDMERAVDRILSAQKTGEKIAVWSDYDCDGIPGGVALTEFLRAIGLSVVHYIPHRHKEGYGLNEEGITELKEQGATLVITVDLGTTEHANILFAKERGIDVIVTDHHIVPTLEIAEQFPALAFINPKRADSLYPFDGLCGAGVAWKLIQGVLAKNRFGMKEGQEKWFLDLIGMATLSDMVPLVGENRMLARYGLLVMRKGRRPGLAALLKLLKIKPSSMTEDDIGFMIAPRINAASRMDKPETAARLLATNEAEEALELAQILNHINDERKGMVAATVKEVNKRMHEHQESPVIVMGNPNWRPGILGLVANTLAQTHGKPVFLWGREGGDVIRGSVRGDSIVNIVQLMEGAKDIFQHFGGHHSSGGFSLAQERVHELGPRLNEAFKALGTKEIEEKEIIIDRTLDIAELPFAQAELMKLAPFGVANEKPLFIFPRVSIARTKMFGKNNDHLELELKGQSSPLSVAGISFFSNVDSFSKQAEMGGRVDVVGNVELDWRGRPRIRVVDII
ncbi:MAG: single-stranded-DNA-specific exonuclease [Parcubacteria group bacterium Gr01-1014_56]|nr:MAG: single-stranded-DNA-specific exonuclease [Parcubacteria group bacterium Gr01-1014_56]